MGFLVMTGFLPQFWATVLLIIWLTCRIHRCHLCWRIHPEGHWVQSVMLVAGLGVSIVVGELRSSGSWTYVVVYLSHLAICGLWLFMSALLGRPLELDGIAQTHKVVHPVSFLLRSLWRVYWKGWFFMSNRLFFCFLIFFFWNCLAIGNIILTCYLEE